MLISMDVHACVMGEWRHAQAHMQYRECVYACTDICTNARWLYHAGGLLMWVYIFYEYMMAELLIGVMPEPRTVESLGLLHWMAVWWLTVKWQCMAFSRVIVTRRGGWRVIW